MASRLPMTLTEKILYAHAMCPPQNGLRAGDIVRVKVDWTIASELAWNGMDKTYSKLGRPPISNRERFYLAVDHTVDNVTLVSDPKAQRLTELSRSFAREVAQKSSRAGRAPEVAACRSTSLFIRHIRIARILRKAGARG